jgi:hypothetical protein
MPSEDLTSFQALVSSINLITSGKQGISPGSFGPSVPVAQPGLTKRD